jgi:hypothetical protein
MGQPANLGWLRAWHARHFGVSHHGKVKQFFAVVEQGKKHGAYESTVSLLLLRAITKAQIPEASNATAERLSSGNQ